MKNYTNNSIDFHLHILILYSPCYMKHGMFQQQGKCDPCFANSVDKKVQQSQLRIITVIIIFSKKER